MKTILKVLLSLSISFSSLSFAGTSSFDYSQDYNVLFGTLSENIVCGGDNKGTGNMLTCFAYQVPHKPKACKGKGLEFVLTASGNAKTQCTDHEFDPLNQAEDITELAPYGSTVKGKNWQCKSTMLSLNCTSSSKHGFKISRSVQTVF